MALAHAEPTDEQLSSEQERMRREDKLARMLKAEEEDALGYAQTEVLEQQMEALRRYYGEKYGDEEDGRSQVTTREVFETIEWTRPDLMRVFGSGGNVVYLEETSPEDARYAKDAADYLQWIFWQDNPGFELLDDFAFDGMLHRRGYMACYWRDAEYQSPQTLTGLNEMQVLQLQQEEQAGNIEILGWDEGEEQSEAGGVTLMVRRRKSPARAEIVTIAPEDIRFNGRAVTLDKARYVGRVMRMLRGEIVRMWPEKEEEILGYNAGASGQVGAVRRSEDVRAERFQDDDEDWHEAQDEASQEMEVLEEYLRVDLNEDGYPELIRSFRLGDVILEESEVEENPFASWTPIRIPHRFMGLSVHDTTADLQRQSTVITRAGLDALYQSVVNREAYDSTKVDVQSLLATYSGAKVAVNGSPGDAILPLTGGLATAQQAWEALEVIRRRMEDRTGATRQTRGLDADALSKDHSGVALDKLQLNADARKEMTARNMASGLGDLFSKLYRLVCRNQNQPRAAKVGGKWAQFDPRTWNSDLRVSVYSGGMNRERSLVGLQLIGAEQEKVIEVAGLSTPNVTPQHRYNYQEALCREVGFKSAEPFFGELPEGWQPPQQPDPEMAKVQAQAQGEQQKLQVKAQSDQATHALDQQKAQAQIQAQRDEAAARIELAREESAARIAVMREEAQMKAQQASDQMRADYELARMKMEQDKELEIMRIQSAERVGKAKASANGSGEAPKVDTDVNGR